MRHERDNNFGELIRPCSKFVLMDKGGQVGRAVVVDKGAAFSGT